MKKVLVLFLVAISVGCAVADPPQAPFAGSWEIRGSGTTASLRGLHVVDGAVAWASGSGGTVLRSVDGGEHWELGVVPGAEHLDFRDVFAWDRDRALVLSAGLPAMIYRTDDGGKTWRPTYTNETPGVFFNAIAFWDALHGIAVGDPIDGRFLLITTDDGGTTWNELPRGSRPEALEGEANFAASGTCLTTRGTKLAWFGTGGPAARVFRTSDGGAYWNVASTPLPSGQPSQGVFSVYFLGERRGVAVGGDYLDEVKFARTAAARARAGAASPSSTSRPTMSLTSPALSMSDVNRVSTKRPSRRTVTRSAISKTSSRRWLT